jgi:hypothetical protein
MRILRIIGGFVAGYFAVVLLTTLGFNVWLGKQPSLEDGAAMVMAGTLVAAVSGAAGGWIAARISRSIWTGIAVAVPLIVESAWLLFFRDRLLPATWYNVAGALVLIGSTIAGALLTSGTRSRRPQPSSAPSS